MDKWSSWPWEKKAVVIALVVLGFLIFIGFVESAQALELNGARKCRAIAGSGFSASAADTLRISYAELGDSHRVLPSAYLVWAGDGATFDVRRFFEGTAEPVWIRVPDGQSLVIPAPVPAKISSVWTHVLAFKGTVSDSVFVLPMDQ